MTASPSNPPSAASQPGTPEPKGRETIGLIGLGLIGFEIAQRFISAGWRVLGWDIDDQRRGLADSTGVDIASSAEHVWQHCQRVVLSLPNDRIVQSVLNEAIPRRGHTIIDTTTGEPDLRTLLASRYQAQTVEFVDATISGSSAQLRGGSAVILAGASELGWANVASLLSALSPECYRVGPPGAGTRMKLVTNLVLGLNRAALAEGLAYADAQGLDLSLTLQLLKATPAYSRMMDAKGEKMIQRDFTPQARLTQHLKDVNLIIQCASQYKLTLPLSEAHRRILQAAEGLGYGDMDNSALIAAYKFNSGSA